MAELYDQNKIYANRPTASSQAPQSADAELEAMLAELPPEERETARAKITAPPTGEDIYKVMQERNANGEVFNMNLDQYRQYKAYVKTKEVDVLDAMGTAAEGVFNEIMAAAGSIADKPLESTAKLTPSLIEAFAQGTRNLYGMAAQSQDPNSVFFRVKNAITANGDDEQSEFQQFMDAQAFNVHSMRLATGKDTILMDKDVINPEMTQVMSYIADPTLFIPFGGIAAKGARMIGMGEGLAKASARAAQIQRKVLGGAIKWGVGAPIEFLGTATRNTIDYGLEKAGSVFEVATGMPAAEARTTAQMYGWYTASAALEGRNMPFPVFGDVAGAMVGSTTARGVGEALTMVGEQMQRQQQFGRGILSYAGQALRDAEKSGVPLSKHAKALLNVLDKVDPLFVYSADISKGAAEGMAIGAGLGYLSAGEEGAASGAGAGMALGAAGAGMGAIVADVGNGRLYDRIAVQRQMVIEGLRQVDPDKAAAFEAFVKTAELRGDRDLIAQVDGIITGLDVMAPNAKFVARSNADHMAWLLSQRIDPDTGRLMEPLAMFPEFGTNRASRAKALSFLSMLGNRFDGDHKLLISELQKLPQDHALRKQFMRLSGEQKKAVFDAIDKAATPEFKKIFGGKNGYEFYGDLNYAEANVARVNAMFDAGNKTQANEMIRQFLKNETGKDGKLTARGELLKQKLATEGYFDKDGNMRPSRLKDVETSIERHMDAKGYVFRRDSTGQVEININLTSFGKETAPHELFHAVMLDSVLKPDFIDRLSQNLLGKFDANGKRIENASVDIKQVRQFFQRYIDALHGKNSPEAKNETARLEAAMKEYESRGTTNKLELATKDTLEGLLEEFGAYYFGAFINDKPVDFLFRGGELGAMREIMGNAKQGFLDFWRSKIKGINPDFNFDPAVNEKIFKAFEKDGIRTKNASLDLLMRDFVRATAMANKQGGFDVSRLSPAARETFIKNNGIRGLSMTRDANGNIVRSPQRKVIQEQMRVGKEIYKILSGLDPKFRQGLITDGEGNLSGRLSPEAMEAMVQSGHIDRAWVDKIQQAYNILDGKGGNVIHFGYLGRTAQIGDYAWPRLVGSDVPFKNRQAVLLGVDFKVGKDGKMYSLFHTLDKAVIDGRADVLWSDPAVRTLWNGDRGAMEADFFRYLANASLPSSDVNRKTSAGLLEDGTGAGARRRDVLHQMLGIVKAEGDVYLNKPIAEIPYGIRHSVTTFNVDGIANMRVGTERWNVVPENAFKDLSRNFQPSEMARENTPNGAIITHASGFKFAEKNGKIHAYTSAGRRIGVYDNIELASKAAKNEYSKVYDNIDTAVAKEIQEQDNIARKFQPLEEEERLEARRLGDVFLLPSMRRFVGDRTLLRQTREEHIFQRALEAIENPEQLLAYAQTVFKDHLNIRAEYDRLIADITEKENRFEGEKTIWASSYYRKLNELRDVKYGVPSSFEDWIFDQKNQENWNPPAYSEGLNINPEWVRYNREAFARYEADAKAGYAKLHADPEYIESQKDYNQKTAYFNQRAKELIQIRDGIEEFKKQNKEALESPVVQKLTDVLGNYKDEEKAGIFAKLVEASVNQKDYSGLLEALFAQEYDDKIQTGKPFVAVTTHGTGNIELMMSRLFSADKLGSHYNIPSSRMGSFSAGSQGTSRAYARNAPRTDFSTLGISARVASHSVEGTDLVKNLYKELSDVLEKEWDKKMKPNENQESFLSPSAKASFINQESSLFLVQGSTESWATQLAPTVNKITKYALENNLLQIYPDTNMQLRKVIRMDNPYVVVDPRSYSEHYISPHMKRAMEAGHDGIVFKRFADGGERDNVYVVFKDFMKDNIKVIDTSFDGEGVPRGSDETGRVLKGGRELKLGFQPTEGAEGGRVYDQNSNEFKFNFIGKQAEENQDLIQGKNLEFVKRKDGSYRITLTDNGEGYDTRKIGHITATIDDASVVAGEGVAEISSNIDPKYRGQKLANILYSEMAERLRSMGIKYVDGTIVNKDGIPVQVRNTVIGQTYYKGNNKPAFREDAAKRIQAVQSVYPSKGVGVYNELDPQARYQPTEGGRTYTDEQFRNEFIGKVSEQNPNLTKNLSIKVLGDKNSFEFYIYDTSVSTENAIGSISTINKRDNNKNNIITQAYLKPEYRGKGYGKLLYSELGERLRSIGIENIEGTVTDLKNRPFSIRASVFGRDSTSRMAGTQDGVITKLDPKARYQPTEREVPTRDQGFNRVYREISRSKKASLNSIKQSYLDKWGIDVRDFERFQQLTDAHYKLQQEMADGKYQGTEREYYDDIQELKNDIKDLVDSFDSSITTTQGDYAHQFTDQLDEIERGISRIKSVVETISEQPLSKVDSWSGKNRLEAVLKRELGSGFAQDISGDDIKIADAVREFAGQRYEQTALGEAFESELYNSSNEYDKVDGERLDKKGTLVDILRSENKLTKEGKPQGEVNPRRIINALRNKSGGDSKVYAEAKAIGLIDWLESKQEGKNQKKITTRELIDFVELNKMGLTIDPQLEQAADFGNTRPYVTGGETQAEKGYRVYVVRMKNPKHEHGVEGHFEGAVVHIRATLRDTKDGRKVMHIEEIQANNTATNELSPRQKEIVLKEIQILERLKKETDVLDEDHRRALSNARSHSYVGDEENTALEYKKLAIETIDKVNYEKKDKHRRKYAEQLYDLNPEFWQDKFANNNARTREKYIELTDRWLLSHNIDMFVSEKKTAANSSRNNAPLQDPKEWVKVAFRTVLRKALVEGVDRITITPWSETPIQVGMKAKSAERFYGKTIADAFNSELAKMNSRLNVENKNVSARQQKITEANIKLNESIQAVAKAVDVNAPNGGADIKKMFEYLHMSDEDLKAKMEKTEHEPYGQPYYGARPAYMKWAEFELQKLPLDYKGRDELYAATQRRANKLGAFIGEELASAGEKTPSGLPYAASEAHMSESQYLVDRSMGFDMTPEIRKKAARPQRMMQPSEGFSNFQTERTPTGVLLKNAAGYVISRVGSKYRVYNPYKAVIGVFDSEEQAKKRIYKEEHRR